VAPVISITASQVHNAAPTHVMQKDIEVLGVRLGQLQERNFFLEEKVMIRSAPELININANNVLY